MIFVDLNNKNKTFCKKIIDILKKSDKNIVINSKCFENKDDNIKILNIENELELIELSEKAEIVLIFNINDYKKYADYCKRIILIYDSNNTYLPKNRKKINLEFKDIDDIYDVLHATKPKKTIIMKNNIDILMYFIFITVIFILSLLLVNKNELNDKMSNTNKEINKELNALKVSNKNYTNYLFLGDSITDYYDLDKYYEGYKVVNSGISGDQTSDILDDLEKRAYVYNPSTIFLLVGTNDYIHNKKEDETVNNIKEIVEKLNKNLPNAKIYLESIYPINNTDDSKISKPMVGIRTNDSIKKINSELKQYCNDKNCTYLDMYSLLEDKDGNLKLEYTKEGLHMSSEGYEVITKELKKYMHK